MVAVQDGKPPKHFSWNRSLDPLEEKLGHAFADKVLLRRAITHASADAAVSNERLEFLGDRVLGLVVAEKLHGLYPGDAEGVLALKFNALARGAACARAATAAGLAEHLILAQSEQMSGGRTKPAILSGLCEAVIAALYLDGGLDAARHFIEKYWEGQFESLRAVAAAKAARRSTRCSRARARTMRRASPSRRKSRAMNRPRARAVPSAKRNRTPPPIFWPGWTRNE
jgi:dsRNA-specific ribonuclease